MTVWLPVPGLLTAGDDDPRPTWTAVPDDGEEPGFWPIFDSEAECVELCDALNSLGWSENGYFDYAHEVDEAIKAGTLDKLVARRATRGFWRRVWAILRGGER